MNACNQAWGSRNLKRKKKIDKILKKTNPTFTSWGFSDVIKVLSSLKSVEGSTVLSSLIYSSYVNLIFFSKINNLVKRRFFPLNFIKSRKNNF